MDRNVVVLHLNQKEDRDVTHHAHFIISDHCMMIYVDGEETDVALR